MADPKVFLEAGPRRLPRRGGIKTIAGEFVAANRLLASAGLEWVDGSCGFTELAPGLCWGQTPNEDTKSFGGFPVFESPVDNFALYAGVECYAHSTNDFIAEARRKLEFGEDRGIELGLVTHLSALTDPTAATDLVNAIALAEQHADSNYVGLPVLTMSRAAATVAKAAGALVEGDNPDDAPTTVNGTPVLATGAITSNTRVWATGMITVYASDVVANTAVDHRHNREMAIAERGYGLAIDCAYVYSTEVSA